MYKKWWLYVLKLKEGKWYVGITSQTPKVRFDQHRRGFAGAAWTKKYKPLKIHYVKDLGVCMVEQAQLYEARVTRKYMEQYGDNNVRGGDLTDTEDYIRRFGRLISRDDWEAITLIVFFMLVFLYFLLDKYFL